MTGERGSDGVTDRARAKGTGTTRRERQMDTNGQRATERERKKGGREGQRKWGWGESRSQGLLEVTEPPSHSWDHRALQGLLSSHSPALEWGPSWGQ